MTYHAFVSYSRAADGRLAPAVRIALHRLARPWYRLRALHVFCDVTNLSAAPELWPRIERALHDSSSFVLLASPTAAASKWVAREIKYWLAKPNRGPIYLMLTSGEIVWDDDHGDFDYERSTAIPAALSGVFASVPGWVDMRWALTDVDLSLKNPRFADQVATLAAPIHGCDKDVLVGEDVRQQRRTRIAVTSTLVALTVLLAIAVVSAVVASEQLQRATRNLADSIAANTLTSGDERDVALLSAIAASRTADTTQTTGALLRLLQRNRHAVRFLYPRSSSSNVVSLAVSPQGQVAAAVHTGSPELWNASGERQNLASGPQLFAFAGEHLLTLESLDGESLVLRDGNRIEKVPGDPYALNPVPSRPLSMLVTNLDASAIAYTLGSDDGSSVVNVCLRSPHLLCRVVKDLPSDAQLRALAFSDDGARIGVAWTDQGAAVVREYRTADLTPERTASRPDAVPLALIVEGRDFHVLLASGDDLIVANELRSASRPPLGLPRPRFSETLIAAASGVFSAYSDAFEGVGVPDVDTTIVVLERLTSPNGILSQRYPPERGIVSISGTGEIAARVCSSPHSCRLRVGARELAGNVAELTSGVFTPDGRAFAAATRDGRLVSWRTADGSIMAVRQTPKPLVAVHAPSNDRLLLVGADTLEVVTPWSLAPVAHIDAEPGAQAAMTTSGRIVAGQGDQVWSYDAARGEKHTLTIDLASLPAGHDGDDNGVDVLALSRDGRYLATAANAVGEGTSPRILLRDLADASRQALLLAVDNHVVHAVTIGSTLLAAATDSEIRLWDRSSGRPVGLPFAVQQTVTRLDFMNDDSSLIVYCEDGSVETIMLAASDLQRLACAIVNRDLTTDEWQATMPALTYQRHCESILGRELPERWGPDRRRDDSSWRFADFLRRLW